MQIQTRILPIDIRDISILHSSERYITFIALENCIEYFLLVGCIGENAKPIVKSGNELKVFRCFLNAIESMENVLDYLYHDKNVDKSQEEFRDFKKYLLEKYPVLQEISDTANAYKHCKRRDKTKKRAKDIVFDHDVILRGFKFWADYINSSQKRL